MPVRPIAQVTACAVPWLWPARLALGKATLFEGDPELGKSWIALDLCARLSAGRPWPDGAPGAGPANALIFSEDDEADTLAPRLHALGADAQRVHSWPSNEPLPCLPAQLREFEQAIADADARLVVLDPLAALLDAGLATNNDAVRRLLGDLGDVARRRNCALLLLRHLTKKHCGSALYHGAGAVALVSGVRLAWLAAPDPHDRTRGLLASLKTNLAAAPPTLAFQLAPSAAGVSSLQWLGPDPWKPNQRLRPIGNPGARRLARAQRVLRALLKNGPRLSRDIWRAARRHRFGRSTMFRAKAKENVRIHRIPYKGEVLVFWLLPGQKLPDWLPLRHPNDETVFATDQQG